MYRGVRVEVYLTYLCVREVILQYMGENTLIYVAVKVQDIEESE